MKKVYTALLVITCILLNVSLLSANNDSLKDWKYSKEIKVEGKNKYKSVFLDDHVYKYALPSLSDLRIADENGGFVAYYIQSGFKNYAKVGSESLSRIVSKSDLKNDTLIDFEILPSKAGVDTIGNRLAFDVDRSNFLKQIEVYGSTDGIAWNYLISDNIYKVENISKTEIAFGSVQRYGFYRIKIKNNLEKIDIRELKLLYDTNKIEEGSFKRSGSLKYSIKNEGKQTVISLNNENRLKVNEINLDIDGTFNREYSVFVKSGETLANEGPWDDLYNLNFKDLNIKNTSIKLDKNLADQEIVIKIQNNDDRPLNIKNISVNYAIDKIVFEGNGSGYKLLFGNAKAGKPTYDLETYSGNIEGEPQDIGTLGKLVAAAEAKTQEKPAYNFTTIFNITIGVLAVGLIALLVVRLNVIKR